MDEVERSHAQAVERLASSPGRIFVLGGVDSGKTTFCMLLARAGLEAGHRTAIVDADLGQSTIGPPTTVGLKLIDAPSDLEPEAIAKADALSFVGSISPGGHFLELVAGTAKLVMRAIELGARLIIVDTSGFIGGLAGQVLKLSKAELCRPHSIVALARGGELDPIVGVLQRFLSVSVTQLPCAQDIAMRSVDERAAYREQRLAAWLGPDVSRWRIKPTVFFPTLPPALDLSLLHGMLVGIDDGHGDCLGLGILEFSDGSLRLVTPVGEGVKALRLGSARVTPEGRVTEWVDLRSVLGTD